MTLVWFYSNSNWLNILTFCIFWLLLPKHQKTSLQMKFLAWLRYFSIKLWVQMAHNTSSTGTNAWNARTVYTLCQLSDLLHKKPYLPSNICPAMHEYNSVFLWLLSFTVLTMQGKTSLSVWTLLAAVTLTHLAIQHVLLFSISLNNQSVRVPSAWLEIKCPLSRFLGVVYRE